MGSGLIIVSAEAQSFESLCLSDLSKIVGSEETVSEHWSGLPGEMVGSASPGAFKACLEILLCDLL